MIKRLQVQVPAGAAGEFSSPESTLCADLYVYFTEQILSSSSTFAAPEMDPLFGGKCFRSEHRFFPIAQVTAMPLLVNSSMKELFRHYRPHLTRKPYYTVPHLMSFAKLCSFK